MGFSWFILVRWVRFFRVGGYLSKLLRGETFLVNTPYTPIIHITAYNAYPLDRYLL
jgi:hypothetical protein